MLYNVLLIVQIVVSVAIIVLVLMQQGKGADAGAAFGSGASGTVFGAQGSANFLSRTTAILATVFFLNCIALAFLASGRTIASVSIMDSAKPSVESKVEVVAPAVSDVPPAPAAAGDKAVTSDVPVADKAADSKAVDDKATGDVPPAPVVEDKAAAKDKPESDKKTPAKDEKPVQEKK
jgi:preprotein translocase subunit SecG